MVSEVDALHFRSQSNRPGIDRIRMGSATALYDALYLGSQALEPRKGRKVMVVITDGGDTVSQVDYKEAVRAAQDAEAIVYSIIVVPIEASAGRDTGGEHALIQISEDTGGKYFYAVVRLATGRGLSPDQRRTAHAVPAGVLSLAAAFRFEFRRIQVTVSGLPADSRFKVRHRTGYYTSKSH